MILNGIKKGGGAFFWSAAGLISVDRSELVCSRLALFFISEFIGTNSNLASH